MAAQREWFEKDYYKTLGVSDTATAKEITKAYRKLARQLHPDQNPGNAEAEERFKEVSSPSTSYAADTALKRSSAEGLPGFLSGCSSRASLR